MHRGDHTVSSTGPAAGLHPPVPQRSGRRFEMPVRAPHAGAPCPPADRFSAVQFGPFDDPRIVAFLVTSAIALGLLAEQTNDG